MSIVRNVLFAILATSAIAMPPCYADLYHYSDAPLGPRAAGFGGAYTAISDDASGVVYNPGGLAFATKNQISASANSFRKSRIISEGAFGGKDVVVSSSGQNSFFGGVYRLEALGDLAAGFAIYTPDNESMDQEYNLGEAPELYLNRAYVREKSDHTVTRIAGALSKKVTMSTSVGFSLGFARYRESRQLYIDAVLGPLKTSTPLPKPIFNNFAQSGVFLFEADVLEIGLGTRAALTDNLDIGLAVSAGHLLHQSYVEEERISSIITHEDGSPITEAEVGVEGMEKVKYNHSEDRQESDDMFGSYPVQIRTGIAWRPNLGTTLSLDAAYFTPHRGDGRVNVSEWHPVLNAAMGAEFSITNELLSRVGFFSNNDASSKPTEDGANYSDSHIDYYGSTIFMALKRGDAEYTAGAVYQLGRGYTSAVKTVDFHPVQKARSEVLTLTLALASVI